MKKLLLICLTAMCAVAAWADYDFADGGFYYTLGDDNTCTVTSGDDAYSGDIVIPSTVENNGITYTVVAVAASAFNGCTGVTSLIVPSTVTSVGLSAFAGCTSLATVTFKEGAEALEFITDGVFDTPFANCPVTTLYMGRQYSSSGGKSSAVFRTLEQLKTLTLGQYVTELELCAFHDCSSLKELIIEDADTELYFNTAWWDLDEDEEYHDDGEPGNDETEPFYGSPLATVYMGRNINYTCSGNNSAYRSPFRSTAVQNALTSITFGKNVTAIPESLLYGCSLITVLTLPDAITSIGNSAFYGTGISEMTIADNITSLGTGVFNRCASLVSATIGNGVSSLPGSTFYNCSKLETVSLGENITSIGNSAFYNCTALKSITSLNHTPPTITTTSSTSSFYPFYNVTVSNVILYVPEGTVEDYKKNEVWAQFNVQEIVEEKTQFEVDGIYYKVLETESNEKEVEVTFGGESATSGTDAYTGDITIPSTVTDGTTTYTVVGIGDNAFRHCTELDTVTIAEENITYIGENAFRESGIKTVHLGAVETIREHAFAESGLTSLTLPDAVTTIEPYAFQHCQSLTSVNIGGGLTIIDECVFDSTALSSLVIPENITEIKPYAFNKCSHLTTMEIGSGLTTIDDYAFYGAGLETLTIPSTVATVGSYAFSETLSLQTVAVAADTIKTQAFNGSAMTTLTIDKNVKKIGRRAFYYCTDLGAVVIPGTVDISDVSIFQNCPSLETVELGEGMTTCGSYTFMNCPKITTVTLPSTFTTLPTSMFDGCTSLTTITLPENVDTIRSSAFRDAPLATLYSLPATPPTIPDKGVFKTTTETGYNVYNECTLYIPAGTYDAYSAATDWEDFTNIVEMTEFAIETLAATDITATSATLVGSTTAAYDEAIIERGFEYWADDDNNVQVIAAADTDDGKFSVAVNDLSPATTYTYRVYATTASGTSYGEDVEFTTDEESIDDDDDDTGGDDSGDTGDGDDDDDDDDDEDTGGDTGDTGDTGGDTGDQGGDDQGGSETGIYGISSTLENIEGYYTLDGKKTDGLSKGTIIVRYADGTTKKVFVK